MLKTCMYINSTIEGLHHQSFKSGIWKKFDSPQWPIAQYEFRIQITRRIQNRIRKKWGRLLNKTRGQKSHATVPLRTLKANYKIKDNIDKISKEQSYMIAPRFIQPSCFWTNVIWREVPFKLFLLLLVVLFLHPLVALVQSPPRPQVMGFLKVSANFENFTFFLSPGHLLKFTMEKFSIHPCSQPRVLLAKLFPIIIKYIYVGHIHALSRLNSSLFQ